MKFDKPEKLWDLPFEGAWTTSVTFIPGTRRLAAGNRLGQIFLWELPTEKDAPAPTPVRRLDGHENQVTRLVCSPDGKTLYSASFDHTIRVWDLSAASDGKDQVALDTEARASAARRRKEKPPEGPVMVEVEVQSTSQKLVGHTDWVKAMILAQDGTRLISGDDAGNVIVWDIGNRTPAAQWKVAGWVGALALAPDGKRLLVSEWIPRDFKEHYRALTIRDLLTGETLRDLREGKTNPFAKVDIGSADWSPDGTMLALGREGEADGTVYLLPLAATELTDKTVKSFKGHQYGVCDTFFTPEGSQLLTSGRDTVGKAWNVADGKELCAFGEPRGGQFKDWLHDLSVSYEHQLVAAADMAGLIQIWQCPGG